MCILIHYILKMYKSTSELEMATSTYWHGDMPSLPFLFRILPWAVHVPVLIPMDIHQFVQKNLEKIQ